MVLAGGHSRRFGRDKALAPVGGVAMVARVAAAMRTGGVPCVAAVGGDADRLAGLGLAVWPDDHPGEGPLGGILTALRRIEAGALDVAALVVAACDLPWLDGASVRAVAGALAADADTDVAVATTGRVEPLLAAWRVTACLPVAAQAFDEGVRAVHAVLARLSCVEVPVAGGPLRNVNQPGDLPR